MKWFQGFILIVTLSFLIFAGEPSAEVIPSPGRPTFEKAYAMENTNPEEAATLYEQSFRQGLDPDLTKAARWRLFYLYRKIGKHAKAYGMLDTFGSSRRMNDVRNGLIRDMQKDWKVDKTTIELYLQGMDAIAAGKKGDGSGYLEKAVGRTPGNTIFQREIVERLNEAGMDSAAARIASRSSGNAPSEDLLQADLSYSKGDFEKSRSIVMEVAQGDSNLLKPVDRHHSLYLLGRISRSEKDTFKAVSYFRTAARYASGEERDRLNALAAYSLYREGYSRQALALVDSINNPKDNNIFLLQRILRVEQKDDSRALDELRSQESALQQAKKTGNASFLEGRALQLLQKKGGR